jgi:hypothetical protein
MRMRRDFPPGRGNFPPPNARRMPFGGELELLDH